MDYLVVGLGNIGDEYAATRHNMGFMVLDAWAQASDTVFQTRRYGDLAVIPFKGRNFYLLKPSTYMNLSGNAVRYWLQKLPVTLERTIVVCDDINLPFGTVRMRERGSDGGHNGLGNICEVLGTQDYARIRMGVGHDFSQGGQVDYVLGKLTAEESAIVKELAPKVAAGIREWALAGPQRAMNMLNVNPSKGEKPEGGAK